MKCTCDFSGANCWRGCECGALAAERTLADASPDYYTYVLSWKVPEPKKWEPLATLFRQTASLGPQPEFIRSGGCLPAGKYIFTHLTVRNPRFPHDHEEVMGSGFLPDGMAFFNWTFDNSPHWRLP